MNHNYRSLVADAAALVTIPEGLADALRDLDRMFGICSLDAFHIEPPTAVDSAGALRMCDQVLALFDRDLVASLAGGTFMEQNLPPNVGDGA